MPNNVMDLLIRRNSKQLTVKVLTQSDSTLIKVGDQYVKHIRPLIRPKCNHLLLNQNGMQLSKLTNCMGKLVLEAIGKYIHPTRYRHIIETESSQLLTTEECQLVSEDQKHSLRVANVANGP